MHRSQMLGIVVATESPDLEAQRETLVKETAATSAQIAATEDNILRLLAAVKGDILDDEVLMKVRAEGRGGEGRERDQRCGAS